MRRRVNVAAQPQVLLLLFVVAGSVASQPQCPVESDTASVFAFEGTCGGYDTEYMRAEGNTTSAGDGVKFAYFSNKLASVSLICKL